MLPTERLAVLSDIHAKHVNELYEQNVEFFFNFKRDGI
jgi:hypothetical protein